MGWIPGLGRSLVSRNNLAGALPQEKALKWEDLALWLESSPSSLQQEKARVQPWRPSTAKNKYISKQFFKNAFYEIIALVKLFIYSFFLMIYGWPESSLMHASLVFGEQGLFFAVRHGHRMVVASLVVEHGL